MCGRKANLGVVVAQHGEWAEIRQTSMNMGGIRKAELVLLPFIISLLGNQGSGGEGS